MSQIAVRLTDNELQDLDSAVAAGGFRTRADAIREGIHLLRGKTREDLIAASYRKAYADKPLSDEEAEMLDAAADLAAELPL